MTLDNAAAVLGERIEALAVALHVSGVSPERSADLLAAAVAASMRALKRLDDVSRPAELPRAA